MRLITTSQISAAVLTAALAMPLAAMAQTKDVTAANQAQTGTGRQAQVEQRIADMHATLKITPAEENQFNQFAQVMLDNAQAIDMLAGKNAAGREQQTADQILKGYAAYTQQHAENMQKLSGAFDTLYAALTPSQKKEADMMFRERAEQRDQKQGAMQPEPKPGVQKQGG